MYPGCLGTRSLGQRPGKILQCRGWREAQRQREWPGPAYAQMHGICYLVYSSQYLIGTVMREACDTDTAKAKG